MRELFPHLTIAEGKRISETRSIPGEKAKSVESFDELNKEVAKLSYYYKDYLLFFRGQDEDYKNKRNNKSTFYPTMYRVDNYRLSNEKLQKRFDKLECASTLLVELFKINGIQGIDDVEKRKEIQWSILQHYKVCDTPYLDLTQSLRVACSFAFPSHNQNFSGKGYIYVFALPYFTNRISINSEHDLINIRLLSICPPEALRPHFQEGFMVGTTNVTDNYKDKAFLDLNRRLVAKFEINWSSFWDNKICDSLKYPGIIDKESLFPEGDKMLDICNLIGEIIESLNFNSLSRSYKKLWEKLEDLVNDLYPEIYLIHEKLNHFRFQHSVHLFTIKKIDSICQFIKKLDKSEVPKKEILENYLIVYLLIQKISERKKATSHK